VLNDPTAMLMNELQNWVPHPFWSIRQKSVFASQKYPRGAVDYSDVNDHNIRVTQFHLFMPVCQHSFDRAQSHTTLDNQRGVFAKLIEKRFVKQIWITGLKASLAANLFAR
jgi:hypothetical protein